MSASIRIVLPCALVLGFAAAAAQAQNFGPPEQREVWMEGSRIQVWKNGFGECWHSAFGPPPPAHHCGPVLAQYVPPRQAPSVAIPAPPPLAARPAVIAAPPPPAAAPPAPAPYVAPVMAPRRDRN